MATFPRFSTRALQAVEKRFQANFEAFSEVGAAVSVWQNGEEIVHLAGGSRDREGLVPWEADTLVPIWSCTKGPAVATVLWLLERSEYGLETQMGEIWPAFAQAGKERLTVGEVLSHRAGLPALEEEVAVTDEEAVVRALEKQAPAWEGGHGYHPRTFGFLLQELARRLTGGRRTLGDVWREALAEPLDLDVWIGLPEEEHGRVAKVFPGRARRRGGAESEEDAFYQAFTERGSLSARAFASPRGLHAVADMNTPEVWEAGYAAMGGVASARGLAAFYGFLACGARRDGSAVFRPETLRAMERPLVQGWDQVLLRETAFAAGFMVDPRDDHGRKRRALFGPSLRAFGHPGAGGSLAFADPERGCGFAYVMNQMEQSVFPTEKARGLVGALYD